MYTVRLNQYLVIHKSTSLIAPWKKKKKKRDKSTGYQPFVYTLFVDIMSNIHRITKNKHAWTRTLTLESGPVPAEFLCVCEVRGKHKRARGDGVGAMGGAHWPPVTCKLINMPLSVTAQLWRLPRCWPALFSHALRRGMFVPRGGWADRTQPTRARLFARPHAGEANARVTRQLKTAVVSTKN